MPSNTKPKPNTIIGKRSNTAGKNLKDWIFTKFSDGVYRRVSRLGAAAWQITIHPGPAASLQSVELKCSGGRWQNNRVFRTINLRAIHLPNGEVIHIPFACPCCGNRDLRRTL